MCGVLYWRLLSINEISSDLQLQNRYGIILKYISNGYNNLKKIHLKLANRTKSCTQMVKSAQNVYSHAEKADFCEHSWYYIFLPLFADLVGKFIVKRNRIDSSYLNATLSSIFASFDNTFLYKVAVILNLNIFLTELYIFIL